ncbi:MAG: GNAT family N-acetyltransferase [Nocardioides sp.]|nr:GNAT family N-acetyltransferase [Nocardioides sp.]
MTRAQVVLRHAALSDAPFLVDLWEQACRRADRHEQVADLEAVIKTALESAEQRLLIAEHDGAPAGAVLLRLSTVTPMNPEPCLQVLSPHVTPAMRRKGIGRILMEAAAMYADELGVGHLATAVDTGSRDANRFMARLGLGPQATLRVAPLAIVQSKVGQSKSGVCAPGRAPAGRQLGQILAARRSMRRTSPAAPSRPSSARDARS